MQAFILAAGFGKRMGSLSSTTPKPLLPVGSIPLIYTTLHQLGRWGVGRAVINLHHLGHQIKAALRNFTDFEILFSEEETILGTAGGIRRAIDRYRHSGLFGREPFILINPDTIFFPTQSDRPDPLIDLSDSTGESILFLSHKDRSSDAQGFCYRSDGKHIRMDSNGALYYIGYSIIHPATLATVSGRTFSSLGDIWHRHAVDNQLRGRYYQGDLLDAGTRDTYENIQQHPLILKHTKTWAQYTQNQFHSPSPSP